MPRAKTKIKRFIVKLASSNEYKKLAINYRDLFYINSSYEREKKQEKINGIIDSIFKKIKKFERNGLLGDFSGIYSSELKGYGPLEIFISYVEKSKQKQNAIQFLEAVDRNTKIFLPILYRSQKDNLTINRLKSKYSL
ncbi:MAG: hypothetical protein V1815_01840 [Candidatus Woesearchaeota archaeon]